jgi:hypothetical protein
MPPQPGEEDHAYMCLAHGGESQVAGLYFPHDRHDLILMARQRKLARHVVLVQGVVAQEVIIGVNQNVLDERKTHRSIESSMSEAMVDVMKQFGTMFEKVTAMAERATLQSEKAARYLELLEAKSEDMSAKMAEGIRNMERVIQEKPRFKVV